MKGQPEMPETTPPDRIMEYLIGINLVDYEAEFRNTIENISETPDDPTDSDIVIATIGQLMAVGGVTWPIVMRTVTHLSRQSHEELKEAAVAIVNGSHLLLPGNGDNIVILELSNLKKIDPSTLPPAIVSTVYSLSATWERVKSILG